MRFLAKKATTTPPNVSNFQILFIFSMGDIFQRWSVNRHTTFRQKSHPLTRLALLQLGVSASAELSVEALRSIGAGLGRGDSEEEKLIHRKDSHS